MASLDTDSKPTGGQLPESYSSKKDMELEEDQLGASATRHDVDPTLESYAAIMATNKPDPRGSGYIRLYFLALTIFLCSTMSGFDSSLMGSINALPNYTEYFGLPASGNAATGIVFAIFQVGQMGGALFSWLIDWYGPIWHIWIGCIGVIVGTIITSLAKTLPTFIGGRFLLAFFATLTTTAAPVYLVELSPPAYRGTIAGSFNTFYYVGSIFATAAVYACHKYLANQGDLDWRIPLWLQLVCAGLVALVIQFFPESPRYLILTDRHEEARQIIIKYHANGDANHPIVELEMREMVQSVQGIPKGSWRDLVDLRVLVESRASRYRIMLNMVFSWFSQFSGNNIISYYLPIMLEAVGVTDTNTKLILNIIYSIIGWIFSTAGARLHDVIGRRKMLIGSTFGMSICLAFVAAGSAGKIEYNNNGAATLAIVFIFVFGAVFSGAITPMQPVYPAEVVSNRMRAKAMGVYKITSGAAGFLNTFVAPIALANIGYWFYVFFALFDIGEAAFIYFFFVETKGLTLEELDYIFEAKNPRKASVEAKNKLLARQKDAVAGKSV